MIINKIPSVINLIPLIIASGSNLLTIVLIILNSSLSGHFSYSFPLMLVYKSIALALVWLSAYLKRNILAYLFLFVVLASVFTSFDFGGVTVYFLLGPIQLDFFAIALLISHF